MVLPAAFDTITVTGTYVDSLGAAGTGSVTFTPSSTAWLKATASDVVIVPKPFSVTLSASGTFSIVLPVTNDPDVVPSFSYAVTENISGSTRTQTVEIPASLLPGPVDLSDLTTTGALPSGTTALTQAVADTVYAPLNLSVVTTAATTYTLPLSAAGDVVETTSATAVTVTVPTNATAAFPVGTVIEVDQIGAGQVTLVGASGVTLQARGAALKTAGQFAVLTLRKRAVDTWLVTGDAV